MKRAHFIILITISILISCQNKKEQSNKLESSIDNFDIQQSLDLALNVALKNFKDADYSIYPFFHAGISDSTFHKSFATRNTGININNQQISRLIGQYREKEGAVLSDYILDENKITKLSETYNDLIITISPPMIDEKQQIIYFFIETLFPHYNTIMANEIFYAIKLYREDDENGETVMGDLHASFIVID